MVAFPSNRSSHSEFTIQNTKSDQFYWMIFELMTYVNFGLAEEKTA